MALDKQMELFEDGGLKDEGGTVDPESGNEVPVGSTQEEVRDDIPAQLSEGEFVLPADVVRYHGLDKIMRLRDEAKAGLARMEAMGQMGNSEEATIPDGIPFDINDLDMDDTLEYNQGGFVMQPGFTGIQQTNPSAFANYQPQYTPYQAPQITQPTYVPVQQQVVPTMQQQQLPKFENFISTPTGGYDELREYRNPTTGETRKIPFVGGQPIYPIPEGFVYQDPDAVTTEQITTTPTTVGTTTVRDTDRFGDGDGAGTDGPVGPGSPGTAQFGGTMNPDGTVSNSTTLGVSFNIPGQVPGIVGSLASIAQMTTGGLPEDATMTVTDPNTPNSVSIEVPASMANLSAVGPDKSVSGGTSQEILGLVNQMNALGYQDANMTVETAQSISDAAADAENMLGGETGLGTEYGGRGGGGTGRGRSDIDVHPSATAAGNQPDDNNEDAAAAVSNTDDYGIGFSGEFGGGAGGGAGAGASSSGSATGSSNPADFGYSKGGFAKQMKKSGLASKK